MNSTEAMILIKSGERMTTEFKVELSSKQDNYICKEVAAFATSNGGVIFIGVSDKGEIIGLDNASKTQNRLEQLIHAHLLPTPRIETYILHIEEKQVVVCEVESGTAPFYMYDGRPYIRIGTTSARLSPEGIIDLVRGRSLELVLRDLESSILAAQSMTSHAMAAPSPAIYGQGDLATMNYSQLIKQIHLDIGTAPVFQALQSSAAVANSMASYALAAPAKSIEGQGDLATMNYDALLQRLAIDLQRSGLLSSLQVSQSRMDCILTRIEDRLSKLSTI